MAETIDLAKVKRNVAKMVSMNAPEEDIDSYISSEGTTVDAVKNFSISSSQESKPQIERQSLLGAVTNVPGATARAAIRSNPALAAAGPLAGLLALSGAAGVKAQQAAGEGAARPDEVPTFQKQALDSYYGGVSDIASKIPNETLRNLFVGASSSPGTLVSAAGMAGDIATSSADVLTMILPGAPLIKQGIKAIGDTAPVQAIGRFLSKERNVIGHTYRTTKKAVQEADAVLNSPQQEFGAVVKEDIPRKIDESMASIRGKSDSQLEQLNMALEENANNKLPVFRNVLKKYFTDNSSRYGTRLDSISDNLAKNGESITRGEFKQILDGVVADAQDQLLESGKPLEEINLLRKKYKIDTDIVESPILDNRGNPVQKVTSTNAADELNFKEVVNDIKKVKNAISAKVKMGYRYTPEDIVAAKLMSRWGDYVGTKVPEFAQLNQEYKPIIHAMDLASREFKPNASDFNIKGVKFLKDFALGKNTGVVDRDKLLSFIEQGTENFPGVGDFTKDIREIGNSINNIKGTTDQAINGLIAKKSEVKDLLSKLSLVKEQHNIVKKNLAKAVGFGTAAIGAEETYGPKIIRKLIRQ